MAAFPTYEEIGFVNPLSIKLRFKTLVSNFNDLGEEKRRRKWLFPKRDITLSYEYITKVNATTLWQFYMDRFGAYQSFRFFMPLCHIVSYEGEYVGTGDGSTLIYTLPSHQGSTVKIYLDSVEQSGGGVDYTFASQGGADNADKVTFIVAPSSGERITMDFAGALVVKCRFKEDELSFDEFYNLLTTVGINLRGLLNN